MTPELQGDKILILGFGREGKSAYNFLQKINFQGAIAIADKNEIDTTGLGEITVHIGDDYLSHLNKYSTIIRSPGIPASQPEIQEHLQAGGHVTSVTNIFFSLKLGSIIGITGTKGKSTTTSLIHALLHSHLPDVRLVGNIGKAVLDNIDNSTTETVFVMELSSYQLEDARYSPHIAVILEIEPEHLSYHGTFEKYIEAKANITKFQSAGDILVFNPTHNHTSQIAQNSKAKKITFTLEDNQLLNSIQTQLIGEGNKENCIAAITVASQFRIPQEKITETLQNFKPLEHRLEKVITKNGITFYNDSIATTPEATINALEALSPNVTTLILGGYERGLDYKKLKDYIKSSKLKTIILFPTTGTRIWSELLSEDRSIETQIQALPTITMQEAVKKAFQNTESGKTCILSPAAASYNMFKDFEERGKMFKKAIIDY